MIYESHARETFATDVNLQPGHYAESIWSMLPQEHWSSSESQALLFNAYLDWLNSDVRLRYRQEVEPIKQVDFHGQFGWVLRGDSGAVAFLGKLAMSGKPRLTIGHGSYLAGPSIIYGTGTLNIGAWSCIGPRTSISISSQDHPRRHLAHFHFGRNPRVSEMDIHSVVESYSDETLSRSGVHIGSDVWSGREVHIKEGCTIGDGAVVGMRALVTRNLDPFSVNAGVPASRISYRFRRKQRKAIAQMRWWEWDQTQMNSQAALFANEFRAEKEID